MSPRLPSLKLICAIAPFALLIATTEAHAAVYVVSSPTELRSRLQSADAGDVIRIPAGVYSQPWGVIYVDRSGVTIEGASNAYIAPPSAKTVFRAPIHFIVRGSNVVLRQIHFEEGVGRSAVVVIGKSRNQKARNNRFSKLFFVDAGDKTCALNGDEAAGVCHASLFKFGEWSESSTLDTCVFSGNRYVAGVFNAVSASSDGHAKDHRVHRCWFMQIALLPGSPTNGLDAIMIGTAASGTVESHAKKYTSMQIDHNIFQRVEGESEIISSKTYGNEIAFNLFLDSTIGHLRLRAGGDTRVVGNAFRGTDAGIVINGIGHSVTANIIAPHGNPTDASPTGFGGLHFSGGSDTPRYVGQTPVISFISSRHGEFRRNLIVSGHPAISGKPAPAIVYAPEFSCGPENPCNQVPFSNVFSENLIWQASSTSWARAVSDFWRDNSFQSSNTIVKHGSSPSKSVTDVVDALVSPAVNANLCLKVANPEVVNLAGGLIRMDTCGLDEMSLDTKRGRVPIRFPAVLPKVPAVR